MRFHPVRVGGCHLVLVALVILVSGCADTHASGRGTSTAASDIQRLAVKAIASPTLTRATTEASPQSSCSATVAQTIRTFVDAFNQGDHDQLMALFPSQAVSQPGVVKPGEERVFTRYGVSHLENGGPVGEIAAYSRTDLMPYLATRHDHHEQWNLLNIDVLGRSWTGGYDFTLKLSRQADDLPMRTVLAKGAADCRAGTIFVWSMGDDSTS